MAQKELSHAYTQVSSEPFIGVIGDRGELYCTIFFACSTLDCMRLAA